MKNGLKTENLFTNAYWGDGNKINFDASIDQESNDSKIELFGDIHFTPQGFDIKFNQKTAKYLF